MSYGDLYNQATAQWDALGQDGQLRSLGFTPNYKEQGAGFAYDIPQQYYGNFNTGGDGSNDAALAAGIAKSTQFDKQKWLNDQGIVQYFDGAPGSGSTPEQQQAYRDNWARSFNQFGYNFAGMDDYLLNQTGPGHFEQDPTLGKLWVPDNKNFQTWNNGAMAASGAPQGGAIAKAVGNFANDGGFVKLAAGAVAGAGIADALGGGAGAASGVDVPYDVGANLVNNPEVFGSGVNAASTAGLSAKEIQDGFRVINGVKTLATAAGVGAAGSAQAGTAASLPSPATGSTSANTAGGIAGTGITAGGVVTGLSLFDQLLNQNSAPDTASANSALQNEVANTAAQQAANNFNFYRTNYRPVEIAQTQAALAAGSPEMQDQKAAQAGATITQTSQNAANAEQLRQAQLGIRPDSGNSLALANDRTIGTAANSAAAMNGARQNERLYGDQLRANTVAAGNNLQATAISANNSANLAAAGSTNSANTQQQLNNNQNAAIGTLAGAVDKSGVLNGLFGNGTSTVPYDSATSGTNAGTTFANGAVDPVNDGLNLGTTNAGTGVLPTENPVSFTTDNSENAWDFAKGGQVKKRLTMPPSKCGYLKGGRVHGPGTGTSDSIPVDIEGRPGAIAHEEYVINAKAVKRIGLKRLDRMNLLGLPKGSKMKDGVHLAEGGSVGRAQREADRAATYGKDKPAGPAPQSYSKPPAQFTNLNVAREPDEPVIKQTKFAAGGRITAAKHFAMPRRCAA